jgi:hypothetical protein
VRRGKGFKKRPQKHINHHLIIVLDHKGIITDKRQERMPSSSQVLDHQLIFHITYGFRHSSSAKQRRGEGRVGKKKTAAVYQNIERTRCKKTATACQTRVLEVTNSSSSNGFSIVIGSCSCSCS